MLRYSSKLLPRRDAEDLVDDFFLWVGKRYSKRDQLAVIIDPNISINTESAVVHFMEYLFPDDGTGDDYYIPDYSYLLKLVRKRIDAAMQTTRRNLFG